MSIKYEIRTIENSEGSGEVRHFARIIDTPHMTPDHFERHIQETCSVTKGDIEAVLSAVRDSMVNELLRGNRFYLPYIGYFSLSVDLDMPEGKPIDKVRADYINVRHIRFQPEKTMLQEVKNGARFERATSSSVSKRYEEDDLQERLMAYLSEHTYVNRRVMERLFSLRESTALRWLKHFTETGLLKKEGAKNAPMYFLNKKD